MQTMLREYKASIFQANKPPARIIISKPMIALASKTVRTPPRQNDEVTVAVVSLDTLVGRFALDGGCVS